MGFRERMGIGLRQEMQIDSLDKRARNLLYTFFAIAHSIESDLSSVISLKVALILGKKLSVGQRYSRESIEKLFDNGDFSYIYEILENTTPEEGRETLNRILEQEKCNYRMGNDGLFIKVGSEEELENIEQTVSLASGSAKEHFQTAVREYSRRGQDINYASVCNEAIKAVEALAHQFLDDKYKNATLGACLEPLRQKHSIPSFIMEPIKKIWESSNHGDSATRHEGSSVDEPEAYYILIMCSAFMNYVYKTASISD